jgi:AcrR family transcriptional regulator
VAKEVGLAQFTLRDVAHRVGMQPPSLYSHFASKNAIYDAMFADAWVEFRRQFAALGRPRTVRSALKRWAHAFFDFAVSDLARHQLMNQRLIPGFEPTPEAYAPAVAALQDLHHVLAEYGITRQEDIDLYVALLLGLVDTQLSNDPGGSRWRRLLDRTIDMFADNLGI